MLVEVVAADRYDEVAGDLLATMLDAALDAAAQAQRSVTFAVSGGSTPGGGLAALARQELDWDRVQVLQVDERVAPDGHEDRNLSMVERSFAPVLDRIDLHPMPVTAEDLDAAAAAYAGEVRAAAGTPSVLDVVQLGLGADGHTASLVPGDPVLEVADTEVAVTGPYQERRRMTLTVPVLRAARRRLWLVRGDERAPAVRGLLSGDLDLPGSLVVQPDDVLLLDRSLAALVRD